MLCQIDTIATFINSSKFDKLTSREKALYKMTLATMEQYHNTLGEIASAYNGTDSDALCNVTL